MTQPSAANAGPVDVEMKKPFKGQSAVSVILITVGVVAALVLALVVAFMLPSDRSYDATADVTIGQVERVPGQSLISVPITVVNTSNDERDYTMDISARSPDGTTVYATAGTFIQRIPPGATGSGTAGFFGTEDVPMDAVFVVDSATGYKDCPNRSSGFC